MAERDFIRITVKFFANLREFAPKSATIDVNEASTVLTLLDKYKIPKDERNVLILVNGNPHNTIDYVLKKGDIIAIFPPIGGG